MHKLTLLALLLAAPACMASQRTLSSSGGAIPPRTATATYPNWEYFCAYFTGGLGVEEGINNLLARAGTEGWELVNFSDGLYCFKRPVEKTAVLPPPAAPAPAPPSAAPAAGS